MTEPFYTARGKVVGSKQTYELRYFREEGAARSDAEKVPGSYVIRTTPSPAIWRSTRPLAEGA